MDFAIPVNHRVKVKESKKKIDLAWVEKATEHEGDGDTNYSWCSWNSS